MLSQKEINEAAKAVAGIYSEQQVGDRLKALIEGGGERITSWSDAGVSVSKQYDFSTGDAIRIFSLAKRILAGGRCASPVLYIN